MLQKMFTMPLQRPFRKDRCTHGDRTEGDLSHHTPCAALQKVWRSVLQSLPGSLLCLSVLFLFAGLPSSVAAAQQGAQTAQAPARPVQERQEKKADSVAPLSILHEGTDSLGSRLAMRLKERVNQSSLFTLINDEEKDVPRFVLMLSTLSEFSTRPGVGSVYSICWVFRQEKGYLPFLLKQTVGVLSEDALEPLVDSLIERTDGIVSRYSSLLK